MTTPDADTPAYPVPADAGRRMADPAPEGGGVELFPVNFTSYQHDLLPDLDTETHVRAIAGLLAPYGVRTTEWAEPAEKRNREGVEERLVSWADGSSSPGGNTVLYWVGHGSARHLAHHQTRSPITYGVTPRDIAEAIGIRQRQPANDGNWAIVVLDACFSKSFARAVHSELFADPDEAVRYLLLSTAAEGYTELGAFTQALDQALHTTFPTQRTIGLSALGRALASRLGGFVDDLTIDDNRDQLVRLTPTAAAAVSAPLDELAELQAVIDQLPVDEQRHFLPKASGAELGELAWYFHGRTIQRDEILHWLHTATSGALIVTGPAGAGKSALLGHILLHTNSSLRDLLIRGRHLTALLPGIPCPDEPFDLTVHLTSLTLARVLHLVAKAAGLTDVAEAAADGRNPADLTSRLLTELRDRQKPLTLLFDALDEAEQPLVIADQLLRPLAALPTVRLIVGTRRSTHEGPDQPAPDDTDLLDALRPRPSASYGPATGGPPDVEVSRDPEAIAEYLRAKLHAAKNQGTLHADDSLITEAVRRLVTDQRQDGTEPQQFLYARLAAHELLNNPALLADPTPLVGRTHRELFTRALERLHNVNPRYTPLLRALGLAQGRGMPDQDGIWACVADALALGPAQTRDSIPGLLRDAAPYLALDHEHGQSVYRLAHRTFTEHFTTGPDTPYEHAAITTALARHTRHTLQHQGAPGATPTLQAEDVSPYTHHHLAAHARLGHTAAALHALADHPDVLDTLSLTSITTNALHHDLDPNALPPAIAGTVLFQHHARDTNPDHGPRDATAWRRWWRRLGATYIQGTPPPFESHPHNSAPWPPAIVSGSVRRRQLHLQLSGHRGAVSAVAVFTAPDGTPPPRHRRRRRESADLEPRHRHPGRRTPYRP
ncbi:ATP-binding protein [Streptomyces hirsutus]|uniref:ATP-binding protein n=1 Tax=Streptomyces hirsutus TaxID=35620 RepID=UPI00340EEA0A